MDLILEGGYLIFYIRLISITKSIKIHKTI